MWNFLFVNMIRIACEVINLSASYVNNELNQHNERVKTIFIEQRIIRTGSLGHWG